MATTFLTAQRQDTQGMKMGKGLLRFRSLPPTGLSSLACMQFNSPSHGLPFVAQGEGCEAEGGGGIEGDAHRDDKDKEPPLLQNVGLRLAVEWRVWGDGVRDHEDGRQNTRHLDLQLRVLYRTHTAISSLYGPWYLTCSCAADQL